MIGNDPTLAVIGVTLRQLRQQRELTIEQLAARSRITANYLGDVERGSRNPTVKVLARVLSGLNVSWAEFGSLLDNVAGHR